MSKKATEFQKKEMSKMYRGKEIFKPLNTGWIDENVACVREWVANIFFYRKGDTAIMIDAGYNYDRLAEKMGWLSIDPASVRHILITHQDTDHVGAVEADSPGLSNASLSPVIPGGTWYISLTISICSPATRCGSVRTADTALFPLWQRIISWLCSHWRSWRVSCAHVVCIRILSPGTPVGRITLSLPLRTKTNFAHRLRKGYTTRRHPMMPTTNRTTQRKTQRAVS